MDELVEMVASELRGIGFNAVSWDSGGGIAGVGIARGGTPPDELLFFFGVADIRWAGELLKDGEAVGALYTTVSSDEEDSTKIAAGIVDSIARHLEVQRSSA